MGRGDRAERRTFPKFLAADDRGFLISHYPAESAVVAWGISSPYFKEDCRYVKVHNPFGADRVASTHLSACGWAGRGRGKGGIAEESRFRRRREGVVHAGRVGVDGARFWREQ